MLKQYLKIRICKIFIKKKALQQNAKGLGMSGSPDRTIIELFV